MLSSLRDEFRHVGVLYILNIFRGLSEIIVPLWVIYFLAIGLLPTQIGLLFVAWGVAQFVFEIPTGAIADFFGRKFSVTIAFFSAGLLSIAIPFAPSYSALLLVFFLYGASVTFESGAFDAWLIDTLKHSGRDSMIHRCLARKDSLWSLATIPSFLLTSVLVSFGVSRELTLVSVLKWLWVVSGVFFIGGGLVAVFFGKEEYFHRAKLRFIDSFRETLKLGKEGIVYAFRHPILLILMFSFGLGTYGFLVALVGWQPYFKELLGLDPFYFGIIMAVYAFVSFIALNLSHHFLHKFKSERNFIILIAIPEIAALLLFARANSLALVLFGFVMFFVLSDVILPLYTSYFNNFVSSSNRATVNSVKEMVATVFAAIGFYFGYGVTTELFGIRNAFYIAAIFLLIGTFILFLIKEK